MCATHSLVDPFMNILSNQPIVWSKALVCTRSQSCPSSSGAAVTCSHSTRLTTPAPRVLSCSTAELVSLSLSRPLASICCSTSACHVETGGWLRDKSLLSCRDLITRSVVQSGRRLRSRRWLPSSRTSLSDLCICTLSRVFFDELQYQSWTSRFSVPDI